MSSLPFYVFVKDCQEAERPRVVTYQCRIDRFRHVGNKHNCFRFLTVNAICGLCVAIHGGAATLFFLSFSLVVYDRCHHAQEFASIQTRLKKFATEVLISLFPIPCVVYVQDCQEKRPHSSPSFALALVCGRCFLIGEYTHSVRLPTSEAKVDIHFLGPGITAPDAMCCMYTGLSGGAATLFALSFSYVADVTTPETKPRMFAYLQAVLQVGNAVGPTVGGVLYDRGGRYVPFLTMSIILGK